jgi:curved DNA-binding protein CbpA
MNNYEILNVPLNASFEEITKSYRKLALKYHPDVIGNNSTLEEFKKIVEAYEVLSDPQKRAIYNAKIIKLVPPKPKPKPKPKKKEENTLHHDPNLGNIIDIPPSKYDLWGQPIDKPKERGFVDSVFYENNDSNIHLR